MGMGSEFDIARDARMILNTLFKVQGATCAFCGEETEFLRRRFDERKPTEATKEHILPRDKGGRDEPENLLLSCAKCNWRKGTKEIGAFLAEMIPALSAEARQRIIAVQQRLVPYFARMSKDGKPVNAYMALDIAGMVREYERQSAMIQAMLDEQARILAAADRTTGRKPVSPSAPKPVNPAQAARVTRMRAAGDAMTAALGR